MRARLAVFLAAVTAAGCGDDGAEPVAGVDLRPVTFAGLDAAVREHKGSVVLVDFWATTCPPCRERFPHLVELHRKYAARGLVVLTLSFDTPEDERLVLRFLRKHGATCPNYLWAEPTRAGWEAMVKTFRYGGGIPHLVAFARDGERVWTSTESPLPPESVDRLVRNELAK